MRPQIFEQVLKVDPRFTHAVILSPPRALGRYATAKTADPGAVPAAACPPARQRGRR